MAAAAPSLRTTASIVHVSGELDIATVGRIEPALTELAATSGHDLVLDLSDVTFCDSSGINLFLRLHQRCTSASVRLCLRRVPPKPARILRMLDIHRVVSCTFV